MKVCTYLFINKMEEHGLETEPERAGIFPQNNL
jgi:hypothetical protein